MNFREYFRYGEEEKRFIFAGERIKDGAGRLGFWVRGLSDREIEELAGVGERKFVEGIIKRGCVTPKIGDEELLGLLPGEVYGIFCNIMRLSGFGRSFGEYKRDVAGMLTRGEAEAVYGCIAAFEMGILPKDFCRLSLKERACIGAFIDEKIRIKSKR